MSQRHLVALRALLDRRLEAPHLAHIRYWVDDGEFGSASEDRWLRAIPVVSTQISKMFMVPGHGEVIVKGVWRWQAGEWAVIVLRGGLPVCYVEQRRERYARTVRPVLLGATRETLAVRWIEPQQSDHERRQRKYIERAFRRGWKALPPLGAQAARKESDPRADHGGMVGPP